MQINGTHLFYEMVFLIFYNMFYLVTQVDNVGFFFNRR